MFSFRGPSARCYVFWCKIVAFILRVPSRPLLPFWAEHAFLTLFQSWGTCNFVKHDDWDWSDPRTLLGVPSPPSFGKPPTAGCQRVFSWVASLCVVKSHLGSPDVVCHCGGTGDRGLFAPQSSCPGSSRRQRVARLPYTTIDLLR